MLLDFHYPRPYKWHYELGLFEGVLYILLLLFPLAVWVLLKDRGERADSRLLWWSAEPAGVFAGGLAVHVLTNPTTIRHIQNGTWYESKAITFGYVLIWLLVVANLWLVEASNISRPSGVKHPKYWIRFEFLE